MRRVGCLVAMAIAMAIMPFVFGLAGPETSKVVIFLPPETAMGMEFVQLIAVFDERGVDYDVVAAEYASAPSVKANKLPLSGTPKMKITTDTMIA